MNNYKKNNYKKNNYKKNYKKLFFSIHQGPIQGEGELRGLQPPTISTKRDNKRRTKVLPRRNREWYITYAQVRMYQFRWYSLIMKGRPQKFSRELSQAIFFCLAPHSFNSPTSAPDTHWQTQRFVVSAAHCSKECSYLGIFSTSNCISHVCLYMTSRERVDHEQYSISTLPTRLSEHLDYPNTSPRHKRIC